MPRFLSGFLRFAWSFALGLGLCILLAPVQVCGDIITLQNGLQYQGSLGLIAEIGEDPTNPKLTAGGIRVTKIVLVDDELRRTFVSKNMLRSTKVEPPARQVAITLDKRVADNGRRIAGVGPILGITPFDELGNRIFSFNTPQRRIDVVQGITKITPDFTVIKGLLVRNPYVWTMKIATSSIPQESLSKIFETQVDQTNANARLDVVSLYIQAGRDKDAEAELERIIEDFPDLKDFKRQKTILRQRIADRAIREIDHRRDAGQHQRAYFLLENFPSEGIAGETLLKVKERTEAYQALKDQYTLVIERLETDIQKIQKAELREQLLLIYAEIKSELNANTLPRFADYLRLMDDDKTTVEQKISLAIAGWLKGNGAGDDRQNLAVTVSLFEVRNLILRYLRSTRAHERDDLIEQLGSLEGSEPKDLSELIAHMKPAIKTEVAEESDIPGYYELQVPGIADQPEFEYLIQLPPEYDPYRRYPCVVSLCGAGSTPKAQIDWWSGVYNEQLKTRVGQGARHGYVVIAPKWTKQHQSKYEFSAREHVAVLFSLRDACRRFAIDTDRVFLSGHSMGGDAAWDIGLAHPDLWAGVLPIVATAGKYITHYWENGRQVPMYFVAGELDGNKTSINKTEWNRYLNKHSYDSTVVMFQGRGHEHFHGEIQRMFAWMAVHQREFFPQQFLCKSMRPWDNYFWWAEIADLPSQSIVMPVSWPKSNVKAAKTEGRFIRESNRVILDTAAKNVTVWLSPEMVDFTERIVVTVKRRSVREPIKASGRTLLEDVRTRGDRQHPFWAKVEVGNSR